MLIMIIKLSQNKKIKNIQILSEKSIRKKLRAKLINIKIRMIKEEFQLYLFKC